MQVIEPLLTALQQSLPRAFPASPWQGEYRLQPQDFMVEEQLGFEPEGQGEHLYLWIEKTGSNTPFVAQELARKANIHPSAVTFSGLKDRHAITRQWFCLHLPGKVDPALDSLNGDKWQVLNACRHPRKLRRGTHRANRFQLRIRISNADASTGEWLQQRWQEILSNGAPNYFGPQRFGHGGQNLQQGLNWLLATTRPKPPKRQDRSIWLSATRSALFNRWLSESLEQHQWLNPLPGSCFNLQGTRSYFSDPQAAEEELISRIKTLDLNPAGPLAGKGLPQSHGQASQAEEVFQQQWQDLWQALEAQGLKREYRPLRMLAEQPMFEWQAPWLTLGFILPSGCFATSLLRELVDAQDAMAREHAKVTTRSTQELLP